jgi:L-amino acid N-acyltransferase YncA
MPFSIRPAEESDIHSIIDIHRYYVENTVITFSFEPKNLSDGLTDFKTTIASGLPYIVAIDNQSKRVLGYCYASEFRAKGGYVHTAELSLFVDSQEQGKGIGSQLLKKLIEITINPSQFPEYYPRKPRNLRTLIACMAVDVTGKDEGIGLKKYYEKFGFEQVGHLKKVGFKLNRWYGPKVLLIVVR